MFKIFFRTCLVLSLVTWGSIHQGAASDPLIGLIEQVYPSQGKMSWNDLDTKAWDQLTAARATLKASGQEHDKQEVRDWIEQLLQRQTPNGFQLFRESYNPIQVSITDMVRKIFKKTDELRPSFPLASASTFTPNANYPDDILQEMGENSFQKINLQNKPLAFCNDGKLFEPKKVEEFVSRILNYSKDLKVLDLSLNRLPEDSLICFLPLLRNTNFDFLNVTTNSGADTLDGMRALSSQISSLSRTDQIAIFKKIIWVPFESVDTASFLPDPYKAAHHDYYKRYKFSDFNLPF